MNTEQLEHELREALAARADAMPAAAGSRVRTHDYGPRTRSLRPPVAAGALTAAAVAGAAVWVVALSSQTSSAFAGWKATPTAASPGQVTAAESACRNRLTHIPTPPASKDGPAASPPGVDIAHLQPVLTDTRGPFTWAIFAGHDASESCISGPSFTSMSASVGAAVTAGTGRIALSSSSQSQTPSGASYSFVEGRAGSGVTAAALVLDDGTHVRATIQNGWFVAWWPGNHEARSALVTTPTGTTTETLPAHSGAGCPPARKAAGAARTCMSGSRTLDGRHRVLGFGSSSAGGARSGTATTATTPSGS